MKMVVSSGMQLKLITTHSAIYKPQKPFESVQITMNLNHRLISTLRHGSESGFTNPIYQYSACLHVTRNWIGLNVFVNCSHHYRAITGFINTFKSESTKVQTLSATS